MTPMDILDFWYQPPMANHWFSATDTIDQTIRERFEPLWKQARDGQLNHWQDTAEGSLALCIVLDQFPLNMFRGEARSFSTEQQAVAVSKHAIGENFDQFIPKERLAFLYMPLMHSENLDDQDLAVAKFEEMSLTDNARFAHHHRNIIKRFGRFPHRNAILGRQSSTAEQTYLNSEEAFKG